MAFACQGCKNKIALRAHAFVLVCEEVKVLRLATNIQKTARVLTGPVRACAASVCVQRVCVCSRRACAASVRVQRACTCSWRACAAGVCVQQVYMCSEHACTERHTSSVGGGRALGSPAAVIPGDSRSPLISWLLLGSSLLCAFAK